MPQENIYSLPDTLSFTQGAVLAANGPVAYAQLAAAELSAGQWLAVTGAAGALGSTVIGMAAQRGISTIAIVRDRNDAQTLASLGANVVVTIDSPDLSASLMEATAGQGLDAVVDNLCVEGTWNSCLDSLAPRGRVVVSGAVGRAIGTVDLRRLYLGNQSIIGVRTGSRVHIREFWEDIARFGSYPMALTRSYPLSQAARAHVDLEQAHKVGHVVLTTDRAAE